MEMIFSVYVVPILFTSETKVDSHIKMQTQQRKLLVIVVTVTEHRISRKQRSIRFLPIMLSFSKLPPVGAKDQDNKAALEKEAYLKYGGQVEK